MSRFDNPYDQREQEARDEDRRQALREEAEEFANEVRQRGGWAEYWASLDDAYEPNDPKHSGYLERALDLVDQDRQVRKESKFNR